jgi:hypothetical protein
MVRSVPPSNHAGKKHSCKGFIAIHAKECTNQGAVLFMRAINAIPRCPSSKEGGGCTGEGR